LIQKFGEANPCSKIKQDRRLGWLKLVSTNWAVQLNVLQVAHEHN
jgi:hypothetical protein